MSTFNKIKSMDFPRSVLIGHDAILQAAEMCESLKFGNVGVMVTGDNTYDAAGGRILDILSERYEMHVASTGTSSMENVNAVCDMVMETKASFIMAVGGGSKIDITKMAAKMTDVPFVSVPTSISHDGIASDRASIKSDDGSKSVVAVSPTGLIADTAVISAAPYRYLAAGCADVISNLTALKDWEFARLMRNEEISSSAAILSRYAAENIIENCSLIKPGFEESAWLVMRPVIASGVAMCIAGSSRPTSGSEHMFSHALDLICPGKALHGEQCGIGAIMMMHRHKGDWKLIKNALDTIGAPTTAEQMGMDPECIIEALVRAHSVRSDRFTILGDKGITESEAKAIAKHTGVI